MSFWQEHFKEICSFITPLLIAGVKYLLRGKVKLRYIVAHDFTFLVNEPRLDAQGNVLQPNQMVHTRSHVLKNFGSKSAEKVRVTFNYKPQYLNVWPRREFEQRFDDNRRYIMVIDNLMPKEPLTIEALSINAQLPDVLSVRHESGLGAGQGMSIYPAVPKWRIGLAMVAMFLGAMTVVYWLIELGMYVAAKP